jgi:dihydroneopterin aldolase
MTQKRDDCYIHLKNLKFFIHIGAIPEENQLGQVITMHLSLKIPYSHTEDKLENTLDYEKVYNLLKSKVSSLDGIKLLEYFCEQILLELHHSFPLIKEAKLEVQKGFLPIPNFQGEVSLSVEKTF